ncbi:diguanylate cyclase [Sulfuricurvum sp.]|uniref:GGDEF domain-containing protein n=1 Tax=Sulfuricurvum sp. TaxID=2025608 RepID=UPI00261613C9|nr:diguanylate cyclase [Sulfuricurvum sp.]MDD2780652.1 diguanylate cyclase [Sulfuricurvum sp.]
MLISIRKVFFNLKTALMLLGFGITFLSIQLFHISQYTDRLAALKNQHLLIAKIINTDLSDPKMGSILINGAISEITLSVKRSGEEAFLDSFVTSNEEQASLLRSLEISSETFRDAALLWSESLVMSKNSSHDRMMNARAAFLSDIDSMIDYQIHIIQESITTAKMVSILLFFIGLIVFLLYRYRLNQIYSDIDKACSVDVDGSVKLVKTEEVDFILKRLMRKSSLSSLNPNLIHPSSGLNNEKGLTYAFNAKKAGKSGNTVFLVLFEIDHYVSLINTHSKEDMSNMFKKLGDILNMYEQPLDVIAHIDNDRLIFLMSRNSKQLAFQEAEKIIHTVEESSFSTAKGPIKITLSGGFLLKPPAKSIDEATTEAIALIEKAKEIGGNRIAQQRDRKEFS